MQVQAKTETTRDVALPVSLSHPERARAILKLHPEVRQLIGRNPRTALVMLLVVGLQVAAAWGLGRLGAGYWWLSLLAAYAVGAFANHCLYVIIHDAGHNLVFKSKTLNKFVMIVADLPNLLPGAIGFSVYHAKHHAHLGLYSRDPDIPSRWEAYLVGNRWYAKLIWLTFFAFVQALRPARMRGSELFNPWFAINCVAAFTFDAAIVLVCGGNGALYLLGSFFFGTGLHPVGGRWLQEHFTIDVRQKTSSYYGPLNLVSLNMGYHNEHHDIPTIPWNRLPRLRSMAPEFYENLNSYTSWTGVVWQFIFDPRFSVESRLVRPEPALPSAQIHADMLPL